MATTVHIPEPLLRRVDARAKALGVSRNRVIVQALETSLRSRSRWPPEMVQMLEHPVDDATKELLDESMTEVRRRRVNRRRASEP